jgi:DNA adenine methylase
MASVPICPGCQGTAIARKGRTRTGVQRYRCLNPACPHPYFRADYYHPRFPTHAAYMADYRARKRAAALQTAPPLSAAEVRALQMPFPYFGGKAPIAAVVWERLGAVRHYVEPLCGTAAVLHGCRTPAAVETVNDVDGLLVNVLRALKADPTGVASYAVVNVSELDLHARHAWLVDQVPTLTAQLEADPQFYDVCAAGWWIWGKSSWIGSGWCTPRQDGSVPRQLPALSHTGSGVHGVARRKDAAALVDSLRTLQHRLRRVRICCGDWRRVVTPTVLEGSGRPVGVLLAPPYRHADRDLQLYAHDTDIAADVRAWAIAHGERLHLGIALCGYVGDYEMPETWTAHRWQTRGGYAHQGTNGRGLQNAQRECVWFSPGCQPAPQGTLWE